MIADFVQACVLAVIATLGLLGNMVICIIVYNHNWILHPTNDFVISLVMSDILTIAIPLPMTIGAMIRDPTRVFGETTCSVYGVFNDFPKFASTVTLLFIAIHRYYRVVKPREYNETFTPGYSVIVLIFIWVGTGIFATLPVMVSWAEYQFNSEYSGCLVTYKGNLQQSIWNLCMLVPALLIFNCYKLVYRTTHRRSCRVAPELNAHPVNFAKRYRLTKTFFVVSIVSVICLLPASTLLVIDQLFSLHVTLIGARIAHFSTAVASASKVFIYVWVIRPFRREMANIFNL